MAQDGVLTQRAERGCRWGGVGQGKGKGKGKGALMQCAGRRTDTACRQALIGAPSRSGSNPAARQPLR